MAAKKKAVKRKVTKPVALSPVVQIGRKRDTDVTVPIRVGKRLARDLLSIADGNGVIQVAEQDFFKFLYPIETSDDVAVELKQLALKPEPINILHEADKIIYGDREKAYGNPRFNLDSIAEFWSVYLNRKFPEVPFFKISAEDVAQLMILLKTARLIHNPTHVDSLTDQAGYAALQHRIQGL